MAPGDMTNDVLLKIGRKIGEHSLIMALYRKLLQPGRNWIHCSDAIISSN